MLRELILKEVKDLIRDPRIWIPFIISALILPLVGLVVSTGIKEGVAEVSAPINLLVSDLDNGFLTKYVLDNLSKLELINNLTIAHVKDLAHLKAIALEGGFDVILIINEGFTKSLLSGLKANITLIDVVKTVGMMSALKSSIVTSLLNDVVGDIMLRYYGLNISSSIIKWPTNAIIMTYLVPRNQLVAGSSSLLTQLGMTSFIMPLVLMIITISVLQMAATSTAVENEERTLEVLLTLPMSRFDILMSKLLGSFTVALVGSSFNVFGFVIYFYIFSATLTTSVPASTLDFAPNIYLIDPTSIMYLTVSVVLASLAMASLGVTIGVLSNDVRIASTISGPIVMLVILPSYYIMFVDTLKIGAPLRYLLYALPFTQPMMIAKESVISRPDALTPMWLATSLLFSIMLLLLTSKMLTLDKLLRVQRALSSIRRRKETLMT